MANKMKFNTECFLCENQSKILEKIPSKKQFENRPKNQSIP